jgi:c-di-GMP-binding flagellar brake protein YcgR
MKEILDKRRYERFQVPTYSAYAAFRSHRPGSFIMGKIVDISLGGLAFRYFPRPKASNRSFHIDIFLMDGSFSLNKVPVQTISDFEIDSETSFGLETRRCSVQFGDLTDNQKFNLRYFIQTYSSAKPEP